MSPRELFTYGDYTLRIQKLEGQVEGKPFFWIITDNVTKSNRGFGWEASRQAAKTAASKYMASCRIGG